jgi:hypothetical protein
MLSLVVVDHPAGMVKVAPPGVAEGVSFSTFSAAARAEKARRPTQRQRAQREGMEILLAIRPVIERKEAAPVSNLSRA